LIEPAQTDDVPLLIQAAKLRFSRRVRPENAGTGFHVWQKRYWDHVIRNESDMDRHLDYIHYNPVKHGLVTDPAKYAWSSFKTYQSRGSYPASWGIGAPPAGLDGAGSE
jgi:putative transposase